VSDIGVSSKSDLLGEKPVGELCAAGETVRVQAGNRDKIRAFPGGARTAPGDVSDRRSLPKALPGCGRARRLGWLVALPVRGLEAVAHAITGGRSG